MVVFFGASQWTLAIGLRLLQHYWKRIHLKNVYLRATSGTRGKDRYENYPVHYKMNAPSEISSMCSEFSNIEFVNFSRPGQLDFYYPNILRPLGRLVDVLQRA